MFAEWLRLREGFTIRHIDPEEDWEEGEQAYRIAKTVNIRPDSTKNPTIVALNDKGDVIGAAFTSWSEDKEMDHTEPVYKWDFDVVVDPAYQKGYASIQLIRAAEQAKQHMQADMDVPSYTRLWVVNPRLAQLLQTRRYGYDSQAEYEDGSAHLVKW
jgi:hypothetical protein